MITTGAFPRLMLKHTKAAHHKALCGLMLKHVLEGQLIVE